MASGQDVFGYNRNPKPDGVFSTENSTLTIGGGSGVSAEAYLVQNWNVQYAQQVEELFEIGSNRLYWAKGHPQGQGSIARIIGSQAADNGTGGLFPTEAFDICSGGATLILNAGGGHCSTGIQGVNGRLQLVMSGVVITSIGFAMQVQDVRIMENYNWRFAHFEVSSATA